MKGSKFTLPNTGKSPIHSSGLAHNANGAAQPKAYAHEISVCNKIHNKLMHIKPTKRGWK